jgi:hypothetical protein
MLDLNGGADEAWSNCGVKECGAEKQQKNVIVVGVGMIFD